MAGSNLFLFYRCDGFTYKLDSINQGSQVRKSCIRSTHFVYYNLNAVFFANDRLVRKASKKFP